MNEKSQDELAADLIDRHAHQLSEHFDTVHIFCTRAGRVIEGNDASTATYEAYHGCYFTRYGQIRMWVKRQEQQHDEE